MESVCVRVAPPQLVSLPLFKLRRRHDARAVGNIPSQTLQRKWMARSCQVSTRLN